MESPQVNSNKQMPFFQHLDELRVRVIRSLYVFVGGFALMYLVSEHIMAWLRRPLFKALPPEHQKLYFTSLFENFLTHLKISGYASLFAFAPYFFYQFWGFVAPGLRPNERKMVIPFVAAATFFFSMGALFAYYVLFPVGFKFFVTYGGPADQPLLTIDSYYSTCLKLMLLFGLGFELPVFITLLGAFGLVDARMLRKQRKNAILGITVVSALFAPPDAVSMLMMMAPLVLLYEGSIVAVAWITARRKAAAAKPPEPEKQDPWLGKSR